MQGGNRILVTGGAGFLGCHLCERLLADGHQVLCLDDYSTGSPDNLAAVLSHPNFTVFEHDVAAPFEAEIHQICNLACPASPVHYRRNPVLTLKTCVSGAVNMLELAKTRQAIMLQASTSEIYGDPEVHPQPEDYRGRVDPIGPRACYNEGKRCAETLCFDYRRQYDLPIKVARIFNTYGPRMAIDDGRVVSTFIVQALRGEPLTLSGDGKQTRSFCYVDDLVEGLVRLMATPREVAGPINIGSSEEIAIGELASLVIRLTGSKSGVTQLPPAPGDPRQRQPDIALAKRTLDWQPSVSLEAGLKRTIDYFDRLLSSR